MDRQDKDAILIAACRHIPVEGWTMAALEMGAEDAGHDAFAARRAFPYGVRGAIDHLADWADRQALIAMTAPGVLDGMGFTDRVTFAVRARLEALAPYKEAMNRAIGGRFIPGHFTAGASAVLRSAHRIWDAAGDTSEDFNWYTKRGLLAGVIAATTLYWCRDSSPEHEQTWAYLDRRIADALRFGKFAGQARGMAEKLMPSLPRRMIGMAYDRLDHGLGIRLSASFAAGAGTGHPDAGQTGEQDAAQGDAPASHGQQAE